VHFLAHDTGGFSARRQVHHYFALAQGIVFMVDAADSSRLAEAKDELDRVLTDEMVRDVPVAVLSNKIDSKHAVSVQTVTDALRIGDLIGKPQADGQPPARVAGVRPIRVFACSAVRRFGMREPFTWLVRTTHRPSATPSLAD
jgi:GTP-binding protein SAR1